MPNMNWTRNRTSRKNKKKNVNISTRYVLPHQIMRKLRVAVMFLQVLHNTLGRIALSI